MVPAARKKSRLDATSTSKWPTMTAMHVMHVRIAAQVASVSPRQYGRANEVSVAANASRPTTMQRMCIGAVRGNFSGFTTRSSSVYPI